METYVKLVEVSPRDGLQNEKKIVSTGIKVELVNRLSATGLATIETTSFVSPKWIPQLADHSEVYQRITKQQEISYPVVVFNKRGLIDALAVGVREIAVFTTPSEKFCQRNANCSVAENLQEITELMQIAKQHAIRVRAYISCVLGCPYEGNMLPTAVASLAEKLMALNCDEISLGDTIGVGTPGKTKTLLQAVINRIPVTALAVHFHNTYGQALANIYVALENGIRVIDSSVAGLGGCPYAKGASGNVASEDVIYMLHGLGVKTGVDLEKLIKVGHFIAHYLEQPNRSNVGLAYQVK